MPVSPSTPTVIQIQYFNGTSYQQLDIDAYLFNGKTYAQAKEDIQPKWNKITYTGTQTSSFTLSVGLGFLLGIIINGSATNMPNLFTPITLYRTIPTQQVVLYKNNAIYTIGMIDGIYNTSNGNLTISFEGPYAGMQSMTENEKAYAIGNWSAYNNNNFFYLTI